MGALGEHPARDDHQGARRHLPGPDRVAIGALVAREGATMFSRAFVAVLTADAFDRHMHQQQ
jgi:hypothetical protein